MNYNFTDRVRTVLAMAREEAGRLQHDYVGTEHILLGLVLERGGIPATIFDQFGTNREQIVELIEELVRRGRTKVLAENLPYTSRAKKVLELAMAEARELGHSYVGTEHLLMGLLTEEKGIAAEVLNKVGLTILRTRAALVEMLGDEPYSLFDSLKLIKPVDFGPSPEELLHSIFRDRVPEKYDFLSLHMRIHNGNLFTGVRELLYTLYDLVLAWGGARLRWEKSSVEIDSEDHLCITILIRESRSPGRPRSPLAAAAAAAVEQLLHEAREPWDPTISRTNEKSGVGFDEQTDSSNHMTPAQDWGAWKELLDTALQLNDLEAAYARWALDRPKRRLADIWPELALNVNHLAPEGSVSCRVRQSTAEIAFMK